MPTPSLLTPSQDQVAWFRLRRSGLEEPFSDALAAARALVGVQAQVLASAGLALSARVAAFGSTDLGHLLYEDRTLVKLWGQRRTLHLYMPEDWPRLQALFRDRKTWAEQALARVGGDLDGLARAAEDIGSLLRKRGGTVTRKSLLAEQPELAPYLDLGIGLFMDVVQSGAACHARPEGSQSHFAHRTHWLPDLVWDPPTRNAAGTDWTRRYLRTYGPARPQDVAFWMGATVKEARQWLEGLEDECLPVALKGVSGDGYVALAEDIDALLASPPRRSTWPLRLLHKYDPLVLAHADKDWVVDPAHYKAVWRHAGIVEGVVLLDGRIAGTWNYRRRTRELDVDVNTFRAVPRRATRQITTEAERAAGHFGLTLGKLEVGRA